jgi:hypothetical protein
MPHARSNVIPFIRGKRSGSTVSSAKSWIGLLQTNVRLVRDTTAAQAEDDEDAAGDVVFVGDRTPRHELVNAMVKARNARFDQTLHFPAKPKERSQLRALGSAIAVWRPFFSQYIYR